jgi:hypothetical protein
VIFRFEFCDPVVKKPHKQLLKAFHDLYLLSHWTASTVAHILLKSWLSGSTVSLGEK